MQKAIKPKKHLVDSGSEKNGLGYLSGELARTADGLWVKQKFNAQNLFDLTARHYRVVG